MPKVSAILLAAGMSQRMGDVKQLLPLAGKPAILHCLETIIASGIEDIVVVLNAQAKKIEETIRHLPLTIALNNDRSSDMAESVRIGLQSIRRGATGILVCLSDHPLISINTLKTLIARHKREPDKIIIPVYKNRKGHPGLFPKHCADEIFYGVNLREIVDKDNGRVYFVEVYDEGILLDMDTPEDYRMITRHILKNNIV
jgi:molybdenum cofactor cytidylyltransferase